MSCNQCTRNRLWSLDSRIFFEEREKKLCLWSYFITGGSRKGPGSPPPPTLFSDKTEKCFFYFEIAPHPPPPHLSQGLNDPPPPSPPTPQIWRSGSATVYYGTFSSIQWGFWPFTWIKAIMVSRQTVHSFKMLRLTFANRAAFCSFQNYLNVITNAVPVLCKFKEIL